MAGFVQHEVQRAGRSIGTVHRPSTIADALALLAADPGTLPVAGGTDLLLDLARGGEGDAAELVDLTAIDGFNDIVDAGDNWYLGAGVTHNQVVSHDDLRATALPLAQACLEIGSPQLRNRATIAGNVATASPANDTLSALMALDATVEISTLVDGSIVNEDVAIREFFPGFRETVLQPGQLITAIRVPKLTANERGLWVKLGLRKAQAISVVHAGIVIGLDDSNVVTRSDLAIGSVAPTVVMIEAFAQALLGHDLDDATIINAAQATADAIAPISDGRATAHYRRDAVIPLLERSLRVLAANTQSDSWPVDPPTLSSGAISRPDNAPTALGSVPVTLNGESVELTDPTNTLLDAVRATGRTGQKEGCAEGECGACTMWIDGDAVMSCLVIAAQAEGAEVTTVEGLGDHPIQRAFVDDFAVQCGYCIPGFLMAGALLVDSNPDPTDDQIQLALSGNLCRCTGYYPIVDAVRDAAVEVRGRS